MWRQQQQKHKNKKIKTKRNNNNNNIFAVPLIAQSSQIKGENQNADFASMPHLYCCDRSHLLCAHRAQ